MSPSLPSELLNLGYYSSHASTFPFLSKALRRQAERPMRVRYLSSYFQTLGVHMQHSGGITYLLVLSYAPSGRTVRSHPFNLESSGASKAAGLAMRLFPKSIVHTHLMLVQNPSLQLIDALQPSSLLHFLVVLLCHQPRGILVFC